MPITKKIEIRDYYDFHPPLDHRTGDIWRDLPCFGLLQRDYIPGIVITPACDLANEKCDSITYIPIISITEFLNIHASYHDYWTQIKQILDKEGLAASVNIPKRFELPLACDIEAALRRFQTGKGAQAKTTGAFKQLSAYLEFVRAKSNSEMQPINQLARILPKGKLLDILKRLVTNAHRADVHFLPSDATASEYSVIEAHSVALFRYPISVPVQLLDAAKYSTTEAWVSRRASLISDFPISNAFGKWPLKVAQLKGGFLSDMISRYLAMYIRLGSDDFSDQTVDQISMNIMDGK